MICGLMMAENYQLREHDGGSRFNRGLDIETVILTTRHDDASIDPVSAFPCFVFITISREDNVLQSPIRSDDLEIIGWGELHRTPEDAKLHNFGS